MTASPILERMDWRISFVREQFCLSALPFHDEIQLRRDGGDHFHQPLVFGPRLVQEELDHGDDFVAGDEWEYQRRPLVPLSQPPWSGENSGQG